MTEGKVWFSLLTAWARYADIFASLCDVPISEKIHLSVVKLTSVYYDDSIPLEPTTVHHPSPLEKYEPYRYTGMGADHAPLWLISM